MLRYLKRIASVFSVCICMMLGGCADSDSSVISNDASGMINVSEAVDTAHEAIDKLRNGEYSNITADNISVMVPQFDKAYTIKMSSGSVKKDNKQAFEEFCGLVKQNFKIDSLKPENIYVITDKTDFDYIRGLGLQGELYSQNKAQIENEEVWVVDWIYYDEQCGYYFDYAQLAGCGYFVDRSNSIVDEYCVTDKCYLVEKSDIIQNNENVECIIPWQDGFDGNRKIRLADGEVTISELCDTVISIMQQNAAIVSDNQTEYIVSRIYLDEKSHDTAEVLIMCTECFCKIPYATTTINEKGMWEAFRVEDEQDDIATMSDRLVYIAQTDRINYTVGDVYSVNMNPQVVSESDKIIPLDITLTLLSEKLTTEVTFNAEYIGLSYLRKFCGEDISAELCWEIHLTNQRSGERLRFYVNALSGELNYITIV